MRKHILSAFIISSVILSGCYAQPGDEGYIGDPYTGKRRSVSYSSTSIYNSRNEIIGEIDYSQLLYMTDGNIIYCKYGSNYDAYSNMELYLYNIDSNTSQLLGVIEDWSFLNKNNSWAADGHLYLLVTTGDYISEDKSKQEVYDVDLNQQSVKSIYTVKNPTTYNTMTIAEDKLFISSTDKKGTFLIESYDLKSMESSIMQPSFTYDEESSSGEVIRYITYDEENIYLLRVKREASGDTFVYIDKYDNNFNFISSKEFEPELDYGFDPSDNYDLIMEQRFDVAMCFRVFGDYFYYENRGMIQCMQKLENDEFKSVFRSPYLKWITNCDADGQVNMIFNVERNDVKQKNKNMIYSIDEKTDTIKSAEFVLFDKKYCINDAITDSEGNIFAEVRNGFAESQELDDYRLYYIKNSELDFAETNDFPDTLF
ncbi:hypothetical protein [Ruminococcus sp. Marseille-P6503]|uniref:hypothetical protein n=1 Tax=Ruminococcus sp. Marseille-P6503 TaxID=2364796 RepID=UPI000F53A6E8|nr:hypothetical protein [Ruminococcus sp. Marseille-P6503]